MDAKELNPEIMEQLKKCRTQEEAEAVLQANHVDMPLSEIKAALSSATDVRPAELTESELKKASGGFCFFWEHNYVRTGRSKNVKITSDLTTLLTGKTVYEYKCTKCGDIMWH